MTYTPVPTADPARINDQVPGTQDYLATARLATGEVLAVWVSPVADFDGTGPLPDRRVVLQRFDASGHETGPEVEIARNPEGSVNSGLLAPQVIALADGGYGVAWVEAVAATVGFDTRLAVAQFDADGTPRATTLIPNPQVAIGQGWVTTQHNSSGVMTPVALAEGGLAVVWSAGYPGALAQYAGQTTTFVQHIGADGSLDGAARAITPWVPSVSFSQDFHDWAMDAAPMDGGGYVVLYRGGVDSPGNATDLPAIMAQTFDGDGVLTGGPVVLFQPVDDMAASQGNARLARLSDGSFVAVWHSSGIGIQGQRFDAAFQPVGSTFTATGVGSERAMVSATPDGGFIITAKNGLYETRAQRYDAEGVAVGDVALLASRTQYPGVSYFGGSSNNSLGHWEFAGDGTALFFVVGNAFASVDRTDVWVRRYQPDLLGTAGDNSILAALSGTAIWGFDGQDTLVGQEGDDTIHGGSHADLIRGEAGDDSLSGDGSSDTIHGGDGDDTIDGGGSADTIYGDAGADSINGGSNNDLIEGGNENDTILGGTGNDTIYGGSHSDLIEGESGNDSLFGEGSSDTIRGGDGDDTIDGGGSADTLYGDAGADSINGGSNNDWIEGGTENDTILGGTGNDTVYGGSHNDLIRGEDGDDVLFGEGSSDTIHGGEGDDVIDGGSSADTIYGDEGADSILGGSNNDRIEGGTENDTIRGGTGNDTVYGGSHNDRIYGDAGDDALYGDGSSDTIYGGDGNDLIDGGSSADKLYGGSGTDTLIGGSNNDTLYGGASADTLTGGTGKDVFVFSTAIGVSVDEITDFSVVDDTIWLEDHVFAGLSLGALDAAAFALGEATTAAQRVLYDAGTGGLSFDADGDGAGVAVQFATLDAGLALTHADFLVI